MINDDIKYKQLIAEKIHRRQDKIAKLHNKQLTLKILLNSYYGALASPYFRYFDIRLAKSITLSGQLAIKWVSNKLEEFLKEKYKQKNKFIIGDTDSVYFCFDFVAKKFPNKSTEDIVEYIDKFSKTIIEPEIKKIYKELAFYMNVNENKMFMKQEKISEKFLTTGKKRYACLVWDDEGVRFNEPELKVTGIEIVRSSTPKAIKPFLKESIIKLLKDPNNFKQYINTVKQQFYKISPEEIAFPRSVSEVKKYYDKNSLFKKGCPIGVRAAIVYNEYLKREFIENEMIYDGEKIKFFYTITPNIFFNSNVFGYKKHIPNREHIIKFVDYNKQFDKVFYDVIRNICEKININIEKNQQTNLDLLF